MRDMQERAYQKRGEQYLLIKSPPASGKSRALMFIALDKLENQGIKQAIIVDEPAHDDELSSMLYVLRSQSDHPFVVEHRELLHKIGCTRGARGSLCKCRQRANVPDG